MELTAANVRATVKACLPKDVSGEQRQLLAEGKEVPGLIVVKGIMITFAFVKEQLDAKRADIESMLRQLPPSFMREVGGGASFLEAPIRADGEHWAEHPTVDDLFCLGFGLGVVGYCLPREAWVDLPGGLPYLFVELD